jgi:prepilin-type N-terminal cleavage/methylation domain-containing protein
MNPLPGSNPKPRLFVMHRPENQPTRAQSGFTLVELLTVIAIIAVLASLLLTALASAKKKSRTMTCTSNLHQFSLALDLFLEDSGGARPVVSTLVTNNYLPSTASLICPEDTTGNWGQLVKQGDTMDLVSLTQFEPVNYSYLFYPLYWDTAEWKTLANQGSRAGIAACQLHGLGTQTNPNILNYSGLLLRAQLDGSVIRRQFFWTTLPSGTTGTSSATPAGVGGTGINPLYPLQIYFDDPDYWQGYQ